MKTLSCPPPNTDSFRFVFDILGHCLPHVFILEVRYLGPAECAERLNLSWHGNGKRAQRGDTRPREEKTRRSNRKGEHTRTQTNTREHKETQGTTSKGKETQRNRSARFARFARSLAALVQGKGTQGTTREHERAQGDNRNVEEQVLKCPRPGNTRQDKIKENNPKHALRNLPK